MDDGLEYAAPGGGGYVPPGDEQGDARGLKNSEGEDLGAAMGRLAIASIAMGVAGIAVLALALRS